MRLENRRRYERKAWTCGKAEGSSQRGRQVRDPAGHVPVCSWMAGLPSKDGVAGRERVMGAGPKALPVTEGASAFPLGSGMTLAGLKERVT